MLGPRIAVLRRQAGMSQAELAQRIRISPSAVGMYEQGRREPSLHQVVEMAEVFGVSTDYLLTGRAATPEEEENFVQVMLRAISEGEQAMERRKTNPFSREELAVLMAAMLIDS